MTEWNNPAELGANTSTSKPCDQCPMHLWAVLHDPANREAERHIRAEERRLALAPLRGLLTSDLIRLYATLKEVDLGDIPDGKARNIIGLFLHGVTQILNAEEEAA